MSSIGHISSFQERPTTLSGVVEQYGVRRVAYGSFKVIATFGIMLLLVLVVLQSILKKGEEN